MGSGLRELMNNNQEGKTNQADPLIDILPKLNLKELLLNLSQKLLDEAGFHWIEIFCWEKTYNQVRLIAEYSRAKWSEYGGERYVLSDYPSSKEVLTSGKPFIVHANMDDPEADWLNELGYNIGLILPLYQNDKIIGLAEVASNDKSVVIGQNDIQKCKRIIQESSRWLTSPLMHHSKEQLFSLSTQLKDVTRCTGCSLSEWNIHEGIGVGILDHSNSFWEYGAGPVFPLKDWHLAKNTLQQLKPVIITSDSPSAIRKESLSLDRFSIKTEVVIPLSIDNQPIGFIELFDVNEERKIKYEDLFPLGNLAGQISIAIQYAQLIDFSQRKLIEQKVRGEASEIILSSLDINSILAQLAKQMCNAVNFTSAYINEFNSDLSKSAVIAEFISSEAAPEEQSSDIGETYDIFNDQSFIRKITKNQFDISQINNPEIMEAEFAHMKKFGAKSILYIPLIIKNKIIGFTELWESRYVREFTPNEISLCIDISNQAAIALENAQLYQKSLDEINQHKTTQLKLRKSERYYRNLFENAHDAIIIFNPSGERVLDVNPHACELFGFHKDEFSNLKISDLSKKFPEVKEQISITLSNGKYSNLETIGYKKDGSTMHLEVNYSLVEYEDNNAILGIFRDVTYRKIIEEQHIHDATHDNLTGLPNRTLFLDILDKALARKKRDNEFNFAVIFFDLDNFKNINDTYGHSVGNKYLKALAVLFDQFSRKVDTIARFGGDEFAILIESFQDNVGVYSFCDRMMSILKSTIPIENINITSTASMGIVHGDLRYTDPEEIIRDADFAMYKAKEKGGNNFEVFDEKLTNQ